MPADVTAFDRRTCYFVTAGDHDVEWTCQGWLPRTASRSPVLAESGVLEPLVVEVFPIEQSGRGASIDASRRFVGPTGHRILNLPEEGRSWLLPVHSSL
jgi:hypothetical protein